MDLEEFRQYLLHLAQAQTADRFTGKIDLSGVVQQTLLEAHQHKCTGEAWDDNRRFTWLRHLLMNNLRDEVRRFTTSSRHVEREEPLADVSADHTTPSAAAVRRENIDRLKDVLAQLPPDQRRAIELHHISGKSLSDVADEMGKTIQSVVGLLFRGMRRIRELMPEE